MSDTNRVSLKVIEETGSYGVTPATPAFTSVPYTAAADLGFTPETVVSELIRSDRQISDLVLVGGSTAGGFESELAYGTQDSLIEGVMYSTWSSDAATVTASDISLTSTTIDSSAEDFTTLGLVEGDFVRVTGGDGAGVYKVTGAVTTSSIPVANGVVVSAGTATTVASGDTIINGTTQRSYTLEQGFTDQTNPLYSYLRGMVPGTFSMTASSQSIVGVSFGFTGSTQEYTESRITGATDVAASPFAVINAASNVGRLAEGGTQIAGANFVTEATIEIENNLRERTAVGHVGATSIGAGEFGLTGTLNTYFDNKDMANKVINNTETSISMAFTDNAGNTLIFDMPRIKFSEGAPEVSGKNEDVVLNLSYQALQSIVGSLDYTLKITRIPA